MLATIPTIRPIKYHDPTRHFIVQKYWFNGSSILANGLCHSSATGTYGYIYVLYWASAYTQNFPISGIVPVTTLCQMATYECLNNRERIFTKDRELHHSFGSKFGYISKSMFVNHAPLLLRFAFHRFSRAFKAKATSYLNEHFTKCILHGWLFSNIHKWLRITWTEIIMRAGQYISSDLVTFITMSRWLLTLAAGRTYSQLCSRFHWSFKCSN